MRHVLLVLALVSLALAASPPSAAVERSFAEAHRARIFEASDGAVPAVVSRTTYEPDGAGGVVEVQRAIPFAQHLRAVALARAAEATPALANGDRDVGYGSDGGGLGAVLFGEDNWPYCDSVSVFVAQYLPGGAPASAIARVAPDPVASSGLLSSGNGCGGLFGATLTWPDVSFDLRDADARASTVACAFANHWAKRSEGGTECGSWVVASFHGEGILLRDELCVPRLCIVFEKMLGVGGVVPIGSDGIPPRPGP